MGWFAGVVGLVASVAFAAPVAAQEAGDEPREPSGSEADASTAAPADGSSDPVEETTEPAEASPEPVDESTEPVEPPEPVEEVAAESRERIASEASDARAGEDEPEPEFGIRGTAELGFLTVLDHDIQLGSDGTPIEYRSDGQQSNLFFFARLSLEVDIWRQHHITFLYQPLELSSEAVLRRDLRIDGLDFPAGTPVRFFYGFPFFRLSWDFDVLDAPDELLAFGLGLQLRNADISFESLDGTLYRSRNDVGPVPLLRARGRFPVASRFFFGFEVDGFYAPISVLNGSDTEVTGAILDLGLRFGWRFVDHGDVFLNLRYLAGGAVGQSDPTPTSDGQQSNWLHFLTLSLGATLDSRP